MVRRAARVARFGLRVLAAFLQDPVVRSTLIRKEACRRWLAPVRFSRRRPPFHFGSHRLGAGTARPRKTPRPRENAGTRPSPPHSSKEPEQLNNRGHLALTYPPVGERVPGGRVRGPAAWNGSSGGACRSARTTVGGSFSSRFRCPTNSDPKRSAPTSACLAPVFKTASAISLRLSPRRGGDGSSP